MSAPDESFRPHLELRQLRYFVAVAECGQITLAAERLGIQQPPLSQQMQVLERQLGVRLFTRHPDGTRLTDAGRLLLPEARRLIDGAAATERLMARIATGQYGQLRVGFTSSAAAHAFTPQLLRDFRQHHAGVDLDITECNAADLTEAVVSSRLHCGLLRVPVARPPGLAFHHLLDEPVRLALPIDHPLSRGASAARPRPVALHQLADEAFVLVRRPGAPGLYANLLALCQEQGLAPRITAEVDRMMTALGLVAAGVGITVVPASMVGMHGQSVAYLPLAESARLEAPLTLVHRQADDDAAVGAFVALALETARRPVSRRAA